MPQQSRFSETFAMGGVFYKIFTAKRLTNYPEYGKNFAILLKM